MRIDTHRILLVDDEPALLGALRRMIERARPDAIVVYASDADSAIWQLETTALRFVLTDLKMQGNASAGWAVVDAARRAGVPIVILSGSVETPEDEAQPNELERASVPRVSKAALNGARLSALVEQAFSLH